MKSLIIFLTIFLISVRVYSAEPSSKIKVYPTYSELSSRYNGSLFSSLRKTKRQRKQLKEAKARYRNSCQPKYQSAANIKTLRTITNMALASGFALTAQSYFTSSLIRVSIGRTASVFYRDFATASLLGSISIPFGIDGIGSLQKGFQLGKVNKLLKSAYSVLRCEKNMQGLRSASAQHYSNASSNNYCLNRKAKALMASIANEVGEETGKYHSAREIAQIIYNGDLDGQYCQKLSIVTHNHSKSDKISLLAYNDIKLYVISKAIENDQY